MFGLLLVDDDPDSRLLVSHALKSGGTFDLVAETGRADEAITLAESLRPDIAVMDVVLDGGGDSLSAVPRLREVAPDIKVVLRSAFPVADLRFAAATGGAVGFLEKSRSPLTLGDDLLAVCGLLDVVDIGIGRAKARLGTDHRTPRLARRFVTRALERWRAQSELDVIELLVSELVTNSIVHGRSDVEVSVAVIDHRVRVSVFDSSHEPLVRRELGMEGTSGRGLLMLDALAVDWGTEFVPGGKNVWFEVHNELR
jgi:CheY-like chemotaxis protein